MVGFFLQTALQTGIQDLQTGNAVCSAPPKTALLGCRLQAHYSQNFATPFASKNGVLGICGAVFGWFCKLQTGNGLYCGLFLGFCAIFDGREIKCLGIKKGGVCPLGVWCVPGVAIWPW